jgi:hypothetical protein
MPRITASELTYGIEIECGIDSNTPIRIGGYHSGNPVAALPAFDNRAWRADRDGSLSFRGKTPVEFVSPILKGADGLDNIRAACAQIKAWGGVTNNTCGLHVHVAFPSDSVAAMRRLTMLCAQFEDALYASTGTPDRRAGSYCRPIKTEGNKRIAWDTYADKNAIGRAYGVGDLQDRYRILNWTNFLSGRLPTVEFRVFSGSLNPAKIAAWVQICLTLVEMALDGVDPNGWDCRVSNWDSFGTTKGEQNVRYMCRRVWWSTAFKSRNYGELGHATFTRKAAERTLKDLGIRHDERLNLRTARTERASVEG